MVHTYKYKSVTWVDLECPTKDEVRALMKEYDIHPLAAEELLLPTSRSKVDRYEGFIYLILHFPAWKHSHRDTTQELDIILGKKFIITARYETIDPLHKFAKMMEVNNVLHHNDIVGEHAGYAFYYMIREIYHSLHDELEAVKDGLDDIEAKTFRGRERDMVLEISKTSRELLAFKHAIALHEEVLGSFEVAAKDLFGQGYNHYIEAVMGEYIKVHKTVQGLNESLHELRETNNSLLETKQNKIMMIFTAVTLISSVVTVVFSWFLVDAADTPFNHSPHEFAYVGLIALVAAIIVALLMKLKRWL